MSGSLPPIAPVERPTGDDGAGKRPFAAFVEDIQRHEGLRAGIDAAYRMAETECVPPLVQAATLTAPEKAFVTGTRGSAISPLKQQNTIESRPSKLYVEIVRNRPIEGTQSDTLIGAADVHIVRGERSCRAGADGATFAG